MQIQPKTIVCIFCLLITVCLRAQERVYSACEILSNLQAFRGKTVSVVGVLAGGAEGTYLVPPKEDSCAKMVLVGSYRWPSPVFHLTPQGSPLAESRAVEPTRELYAEAPVPANEKAERWAIVTGRIEARERLEMILLPDKSLQPFGYGHLNRATAQIVFKLIRPK